MQVRIVLTEGHYIVLRGGDRGSATENLAFAFAGVRESRGRLDLLVRQVRQVAPHELATTQGYGVELSDSVRQEVFSYAARHRLAVVESHVHAGSRGRVGFSRTDAAGFDEILPYVWAKTPGLPYGAIVWSADCVDARVWRPGSRRSDTVSAIRIVGPSLVELPTVMARRRGPGWDERRYERQIAAFGALGQERLSRTHVAVVGAGGTGSHVVQQLAYQGFMRFTVVDDDRVEKSSLNRLVGATTEDIGRPKVHVAKRAILAAQPQAVVRAVDSSLMSGRGLDAVRACDLLIGCTDTDGSRLVLNELARAYLIPYIDCASEITASDGVVTEIGGRVATVLPDGPCLLCMREVDLAAAQEELESPEERELRQRHGYSTGAAIPSPSVVSLNGVVASLAASEAFALVTGWRRPSACIVYYDRRDRNPCSLRIVKPDPNCLVCANGTGIGDAAHLERYARRTLPNDLPAQPSRPA